MRAHPGKCHLLPSSKTPQVVSISGTTKSSSTAETLLGIIIDSDLNFESHLNSICNRVSRKINALGHAINICMPLGKYRILHFISFDAALEKYIINKINRLHETASRFVYSD